MHVLNDFLWLSPTGPQPLPARQGLPGRQLLHPGRRPHVLRTSPTGCKCCILYPGFPSRLSLATAQGKELSNEISRQDVLQNQMP